MNIKKGALYVFYANLLNLAISLFSGFVLPKFLSIETYSSIKLFQLYITYIGILHLGFCDGMYLEHGGKNLDSIDGHDIDNEFKTFKVFQFYVSIIMILFSIIIKNYILLLCSIVILPINVGNYIRNLYSSIGEFKRYSKFTNINTLLIFIVNVILLLIIKSDSSNFYIFSYIIVYFIYWYIIESEYRKLFSLKNYNSKYGKKYLIKDIKNGFLLMLGNFCSVIFTTIDRLFVNYLLGNIKFAFYSFAVSIENLLNVLITPISTTLYNYFCINNQKEKIVYVKKLLCIFSVAIIISYFPVKFIIEHWLEKYLESIPIILMLFASQYISIIVKCVHFNLYKAKKMQNIYFYKMVFIVFLSVITNLIGYIIYKSMISIAIATLVTNIIWLIIGEMDFKDYFLSFKEYLYIILELLIFIILGIIKNTILGFVLYFILSLCLTFIMMRDAFSNCLKILKDLKKYILVKENKSK
jgi:O-antigen/teichoic acid export membrane protein